MSDQADSEAPQDTCPQEGNDTTGHLVDPLEPSAIAHFVEQQRCPRYIKQRVDPGDEPDARDWREAYGTMNIALLGKGREFEATQLERLAVHANTIIGPKIETPKAAGTPDITVDETWADTPRSRTDQIQSAIETAKQLPTTDPAPYILLYQPPVSGTIGAQPVHGDADCIAIAPAEALPDRDPGSGEIVLRVIDIKSATDEQPAHRVQVATYSQLLEQQLDARPSLPTYQIETSVLTRTSTTNKRSPVSPFELTGFARQPWELFVTRLLAENGPIETALDEELEQLPFSINHVCNNCAFKEACATRAVESPTQPTSFALLGLNAQSQQALTDVGIETLTDLATLLPQQCNPHPTEDPPALDLDPAVRRQLEDALPSSIHESVQRAQSLVGEVNPSYPATGRPPAIAGKGWVTLPDDRVDGWGDLESAEQGELIHVAIFVRPDSAIDRIGALGACVYAEADGEHHTIGEVIDAVPDSTDLATEAERDLIERFCHQVFNAIESVATTIGDPNQAVMHCYTYSNHEKATLADGLDRHCETLPVARSFRALLSLHPDGHTEVDQEMVTAVLPVITDRFALQYPSHGLLPVARQFVPGFTMATFDPLEARGDEPPLRAIFREQFIADTVPYLETDPRIRLHLESVPLADGTAADMVESTDDSVTPDGWYPVRSRSGAQFPIEYIWAVTPKHPTDETPRLTPEIVDDWVDDPENRDHYAHEVGRFYYRTDNRNEPVRRNDVEHLIERLSYTLLRLVRAIPHKDAYMAKTPIDATSLHTFEPPVSGLPASARDYLRMEFGARRDTSLDHYQKTLRERARTGRSVPIRCTDFEQNDDGSLTVTAEPAYEALFPDPETAAQIRAQTRIRGSTGSSSGSWRVITQLTAESPASSDTVPNDFPQVKTEANTGSSNAIQHSPPVHIEQFDEQTGTLSLTLFGFRLRQYGSEFRRDHCGWECPTGTNLNTEQTPDDQMGYVAGRPPVWIDTGELYMLDPMVDNLSAPKTDAALEPDVIRHNTLFRHLERIRTTGSQPPARIASQAQLDDFIETIDQMPECLTLNEQQKSFVRAVDRAIVPLQGPPGTGKTSGATAPALLARTKAAAQRKAPFLGLVVAPSHDAVDQLLSAVVDGLNNLRQSVNGLDSLKLGRVVPSTPPSHADRPDSDTATVDITYCNYHSENGKESLRQIATDIKSQPVPEEESSQWLLFTTPSSLYRALGVFADSDSSISGESAKATMCHDPGLADVVCVDEASMLTIPQLALAASVLKPLGQTLLVGDHRQLGTINQNDWTDTFRKPLSDSRAHLSALDYIRWLNTTYATESQPKDCDQSHLGQLLLRDADYEADRGGERW